jgi:hypothetical protein
MQVDAILEQGEEGGSCIREHSVSEGGVRVSYIMRRGNSTGGSEKRKRK